MEGLFTGSVTLTGSHCSAFFTVRCQVHAEMGQGCDIHFKRARHTPHAHTIIYCYLQEPNRDFQRCRSCRDVVQTYQKNMLKYISSMTVWLRCLLWDNCLFLLIWGADGKQASVRQAFWDDSHEIPPQVPLEPL